MLKTILPVVLSSGLIYGLYSALESEGVETPRQLYLQRCGLCHGSDGRGDGPAAPLLDPRPRDFRFGMYRLVSTTNGVPTRQDIVRTLRRGMPGTAMPSWDHLSDGALQDLAEYVLRLTEEGIRERLAGMKEPIPPEEIEDIVRERVEPGPPIEVPEGPQPTAEVLARGRSVYETAGCATCHGEQGRGVKNPDWRTAEGHPIGSRDLTRGVFKGGGDGESLFRRIYAGLPGTPMPGYGSLGSEKVWSVVRYVQSMVREGGGETTPLPEDLAGDPETGEELFTGRRPLANGAPSCRTCHSFAGIGPLGGGAMGPAERWDLTGAHGRFGEAVVQWPELQAPMKPIYTNKPLTPEERRHLAAFFRRGAGRAGNQVAALAGFGVLGALLLLGSAFCLWRNRGRDVRRAMFEASYRNRKGLA